jgi:hypothetical protein
MPSHTWPGPDSTPFLLSPPNAYLQAPPFPCSSFSLAPFHNLFSCSMRSLFLALLSIFASPSHAIHSLPDQDTRLSFLRRTIGGLLWYQGCNDAVPLSSAPPTPSPASVYSTRLVSLLQSIRSYCDWICFLIDLSIFPPQPLLTTTPPSLSTSPLPIVIVAITSTRPWLTLIREIRSVQLDVAALSCCSSSALGHSISPVCTVDTLGYPLQPDCVHLTAHSSFRLGYLLAQALDTVRTSTGPSPPLLADTLQLPYLDRYLQSLYTLLRSLSEHTLETHYSIHREPLCPSAALLSPHAPPAAPSDQDPPRRSSSLPILQTGLKPVNFVYGEIFFSSILSLLREIERVDRCLFPSPRGLFVDLGCGSCVSLFAAFLTGSFTQAIGIDLMRSKLEVGWTTRGMLPLLLPMQIAEERSFPPSDLLEDSQRNQIDEFLLQYPTPAVCSLPLLSLSSLSIREGNFLSWVSLSQEEWSKIKVLYLCSTCYSEEDLLKEIYEERFPHLSVGSFVILLDKQLPATELMSQRFQMLFSCQCRTTWGTAAAYVYRCRMPSPPPTHKVSDRDRE